MNQRGEKKSRFHFPSLAGCGPAFQNVIEVAQKIAPHDIPVLIEGETGTGKEWLARAIHFASPRADREFVSVDCSSFSDVFLESELLGYMRGSFAGAIHEKKGLFEIAEGGTVFLDHVSKMPLPLQGKLLRILNEGTFYKIGGVAEIHVDIRLIAATDQDLKSLLAKGAFRDDLYYQLNVVRITIPPLRERREDILILTDSFLAEIAEREGAPKKELIEDARSILESYDWPGNVRELEREIEKSVALAGPAQTIGTDHLASLFEKRKQALVNVRVRSSGSGSLKDEKREIVALLEKNAITEALKKTAGNRTHAARILCISRQELLRKISAHKIKF